MVRPASCNHRSLQENSAPFPIHNRRDHHLTPSHISLDSITSIQTVVLPKANRLPAATLFPVTHVKGFSPEAKPCTSSALSAKIHKAKFSYTSWALHMQLWLKGNANSRDFLVYWLIAPSVMNFIINFTSNLSRPSNVFVGHSPLKIGQLH
jgi:hypothetical protein